MKPLPLGPENICNKFYPRKLLKAKLAKESRITMPDSLEVLREFENLLDENNDTQAPEGAV